MTRNVSDLPEHLQTRIPQALLDLDHNTFVRRLCDASLEAIDSLSAEHVGDYERNRWRSTVEALKADTLDVHAALRSFDLKRGLSSLVHSLLNHVKDLGFGPTSIRYAHAYLDMRKALIELALFYSGLRPRARAARSKLYNSTVERYDATVLNLSTAAGVAA